MPRGVYSSIYSLKKIDDDFVFLRDSYKKNKQ
jgi:hypothetical protein